MRRFAIVVEFRLRPGGVDRFLELLRANAAASVRDEPGCHRFDVLTARDGAARDRITLYEIYEDEAAFDAHLRTPHYAAFKAGTADLVETSTLRRFDVEENAA